ncbi:putative ribosomal large subunit pseudouridine synthase SVR1, chloroplastic isoform X1 [Syzygium oleosum]|uniref:putative ribosomal large subunit pseudouridine synthase SVR1, chloroplastic isoform X1 n=2 Tax=Syzygium oleosum TaxID=219896 RepID=UPI0024BBAF4A|nr:putative ribosomal large subunit pseudouridine synthase SVR1, chloroplastic isoform X1 [Syzygium oleosum]
MTASLSWSSLSKSFRFPRRPARSLSLAPRIACSSSPSPSSPPLQFDISFAPPKPKPKPRPDSGSGDCSFISGAGQQLFIPWILRGEDGQLKLQSHPPARLIHALAHADTGEKRAKKKDKPKAAAAGGEPKYSKAARRFYNDNFRDPPQRLSKVLAAAGVASRRSSEELIFEGKVTVNGSVCKTPQTRVDPMKDAIYVNGNRLPKKLPPKVYLALNKPKGYICSAGEKESKSVLELFDDYLKILGKRNPGLPKPRLFTVGRLDVATSGLIIVTNDGDFSQKISHPSANLSKEYIAAVDGEVHKRHLIALSQGTVVDGTHCIPDSVELLPRQPDNSRHRLRIVVHEGRNHEVRELMKNAGLQIYSLKRVRIGGFRLPADLGLGKHVELKPVDLQALGWKS